MVPASMKTSWHGSALLPNMDDGERTARQRLPSRQHDFADRLIRARQGRGMFSEFGNHPGRPRTKSDGYAIQAAVVDGLAARPVGVKAGLSTPETMRAYGLSRPVFAPILAGSVFEAVPNEPVRRRAFRVRLGLRNGDRARDPRWRRARALPGH